MKERNLDPKLLAEITEDFRLERRNILEDREVLLNFLKRISRRQREVILCKLLKFTPKETAYILSTSRNAIFSTLKRLKRILENKNSFY